MNRICVVLKKKRRTWGLLSHHIFTRIDIINIIIIVNRSGPILRKSIVYIFYIIIYSRGLVLFFFFRRLRRPGLNMDSHAHSSSSLASPRFPLHVDAMWERKKKPKYGNGGAGRKRKGAKEEKNRKETMTVQ